MIPHRAVPRAPSEPRSLLSTVVDTIDLSHVRYLVRYLLLWQSMETSQRITYSGSQLQPQIQRLSYRHHSVTERSSTQMVYDIYTVYFRRRVTSRSWSVWTVSCGACRSVPSTDSATRSATWKFPSPYSPPASLSDMPSLALTTDPTLFTSKLHLLRRKHDGGYQLGFSLWMDNNIF